ncbi:hypothetical protein KP509_31G028100 [Ceratopteris richardii]|nr:hypothetical protein KP509_31G028100 [Ceratopteris richardii]
MNPFNVATGAFLLAHNDLYGRDERRRNTLGVMLQFKTANETTPQGPYGASQTNPGECPKISTEESNQTHSVIVSGEVLDLSSLTDSRIREESSDNERRNPSSESELALDRHETISLANREQHVYSVGDLSVSHSSSSASSSTLSPTPAIIPSNSPSSSSSWMAQRQTTPPRTPQYGRRTLSKAMSTESCASETVRQSPSLAVGPRTKVEVRQTTSRIQSEQCSTDRDASTSDSQFEQFHTNLGTPLALSSSASEESTSRTREKGLKLPLRRFLAERDEYNTCSSRLSDGDCPWETWQEATEQLDGMCCVCMVGLKGAAFIPCGHTFCRRCSRELWRSRGTCPLCNKYIREILDIY